MNALENWYCSTSFWRWMTRERLLPWMLGGHNVGDHLLEIGAGAGAATAELRRRVPRVTSLEYSHKFAARIAHANSSDANLIVQGDAAALPFANGTFSSAIAVLVLHHLRSREMQDRALAEVYRVLRPAGQFCLFEIPDGWFHRVIHTRSTFVPLQPASIAARLTSAGFSGVSLDQRPGGFRIQAERAR